MDKKNFHSVIVENAILKQNKSSKIIPPINIKFSFIYLYTYPIGFIPFTVT